MNILLILLAGLIGGCLGYLWFYRRYENKELVHEVRKNNIDLKHAFQACDRDRMEYEQQNFILKDEITLLYQKNDDLTQVVSELSRYYYHMKKVSDKMTELGRYLQQPLEDLDAKMSPYLRKGSSHSIDNDMDDYTYKLPDDTESNTKEGFF